MSGQTAPGDIRLVSFDCWATLASGNPAYKRGRVRVLGDALGRSDLAAVEEAMRSADEALDTISAETGQEFGFAERVTRTLSLLGMAELTSGQLDRLYQEMAMAFLRDPPTLTEPTLPATLAGLRRMGVRIAVTSNTGFVPGRLMRVMLDRLGLLGLTDHLVFSDEVGFAKPSVRVFRRLAELSGCGPRETLHIGDGREADYAGALAAGLHALWYRPAGDEPAGDEPADGVLRRHGDLLGHPLLTGRGFAATTTSRRMA